MSEKELNKTLSILIALTLLLGVFAPIAEVAGEDTENELTEESTDSDNTLLDQDDDYIRYINDTEYHNDTIRKEDNSLVIEEEGHLILNNSTMILRIDGYHPHDITIDGGNLTLNNSTLTTGLRDEDDDTQLRPFLKTNVSALDGSSIELLNDSSFKFPGWVYVEDSDLTLKESRFEPLEEVPEFDYTWYQSSPGSAPSVGVSDNEYCPTLTAVQGSSVLIEDSEIIDNYENDELEPMEWWPSRFDFDDEVLFDDDVSSDEGYINGTTNETVGDDASEWRRQDNESVEGEYSWDFGNGSYYKPDNPEDAYMSWLVSPDIDIPSYAENVNLTFDHWYDFNETDGGLIDGGNLRISDDILEPVEGYDGNISGDDNPLAEQSAWGGESVEWQRSTFYLDEYAGQTINLNWTAGVNVSADEYSGWRIDNITITAEGVSEEDFVLGPDDPELEINVWNLVGPQFPSPGGEMEYPYMNPFNRISSLFIEVQYETEEGYEAQDSINYSTSDGVKEALTLQDTGGDSEEDAANIFEPDLDTFSYEGDDFIKELTVFLNNTDEDKNITIEEIKLWSSFDNDIRVEDSTLMIIDSHIDVDYRDSNVDPREGETEMTSNTTYLHNSNLNHRTIRVYGDSTFKTYGMSVTGEASDDGFGDPWILNTEASWNQSWIYRRVDLQITNQDDVPLPNVTVSPESDIGIEELDEKIKEINNPHDNLLAWDYFNETGNGTYEGDNEFEADDKGRVTLFLASDRLNYPSDWPNSRFVGNYMLNLTYHDEDQGIWGNATEGISLEDFPTMDNPDNFAPQMDVDLPDLQADDLRFEVDDEEPDWVTEDTELNVTLEMSNQGESAASDVNVSFYSEEVEDENLIDWKDVDEIDPTETKNVTITWTPNEGGEHTIIGVIDPNDEILEADEDNNRAEASIAVGPPIISISDEDISLDTILPQRGGSIEIVAEIFNDGGSSAEVNVSFYEEGDLIGTNSSEEIEFEASKDVTMEWIPKSRGYREIGVEVEYEDQEITATTLKPIFSEDYDNDLIVGGEDFEDTKEIPGDYALDGFLVVQEEGTLEIGNTDLMDFVMQMNRDNKYSMILRDEGTLILNRTNLYSEYQFDIHVEEDSELIIQDNSIIGPDVNLVGSVEAQSTVWIHDTTFEGSMNFGEETNSAIYINNSTFDGDIDFRGDTFEASETEFNSPNVHLEPSTVNIVNSTFESDLTDFHNTTGDLTAVETDAVEATGDSRIRINRWVRAEVESEEGLPIEDAEVNAENIDIDYHRSGLTDEEGIVYLEVLTDIITEDGADHYSNYQFDASYSTDKDEFEVDTFNKILPEYPSQEYVIDIPITFGDLPNFDVTDDDLNVIKEGSEVGFITEGDEVQFELNVTNTGNANVSGDINVTFTLTNETGYEIQTNYSSITDGLNISESKEISVSWDSTNAPEGLYTVEAEVDPNDVYREITDINNIAITEFLVGEKPELEVDEIIVDSEVMNGSVVDLGANISNIGGTDVVDVNVSFLYNHTGDDNKTLIGNRTIDVAGNHSISQTNISWDTDGLLLGDYNITVIVNPEHEIDERDGENNTKTANTTILSRPDLKPINLDVTLEEIRIGETVTVNVNVTNQGEWPSEEITVNFLIDDEEFANETIDGLEGNETSDVIEVEWTAEMTEYAITETRDITVEVEPDENEYDETNLEVSDEITVERHLDLGIVDQEIKIHEDEFPEGEEVGVIVDVENIGDLNVTEFTVELLIDGEIEEERQITENLSIGERREVMFEWEAERSADGGLEDDRSLAIRVNENAVVDVDDTEVEDQYLDNNEAEIEVTIYKGPDLTPVNLDVTPDPVLIGHPLTVSMNITNQGGWPSEEITVNFYVDEEEIASETIEEGLDRGVTSELIEFVWDAEMTESELTETRNIIVEIEEVDYESDLDNLEETREITVERYLDLAVEEITVDDEAVEGEELEITAEVINQGSLNVEEFDIELYLIDTQEEYPEESIAEETIYDIISVDETTEIPFTWDTSEIDSGEDRYILRVEVNETATISIDDRSEEVEDYNPDNNIGESQLITIMSSPHLELVEGTETWEVWDVEEDEWQVIEDIDPMELQEKDDLRFNLTIRNRGDITLPQGRVEITYPDGTTTEKEVELGPGESTYITDEWLVEKEDEGEQEISIQLKSSDSPDAEIYRNISRDISVTQATVNFQNLQYPLEPMIRGERYSFGGEVIREDGKPLADTDVTVSIVSNGDVIDFETRNTGDDGRFDVTLFIPEDLEGEYDVIFETDTYEVQSTQESVEVETDVLEVAGMPWWLLLVIVAIAAGGAGSAFAYFKFFGVGEMVECGNCGATISADATSCPKCGVEFDMDTVKCSECSEWIPADLDVCPECGAEFVKTGKEVEDYTDRMKKQYKKFLRKKKREAEEELGKDISQKEFMDWWKDKPSFVTFNEWLERKEKQRREGSMECPECGALNSVDDAVCRRCGTSLIDLGEPEEEEESTEVFLEEETSEEESQELELDEEETIEEEAEEIEQELGEEEETLERKKETEERGKSTESEKKEKKVKKKPKKKVKKKVVKKSDEEED